MAAVEINKTKLSQIYDELAEFILSRPTTEQLAEFQLSEASDHYISDLLEANRTRGLSLEEKVALDDYQRIEHLMQVIKIRAYAKLDKAKHTPT